MVAPNFRQIRNSPRKPGFCLLKFLLLPSLTATALLLTGALGQQVPPAAQSPAPAAPAPKADPAAERVIREAIDELDPNKLGWLETKLQQQVYAAGFSFKADGRYLSGPDHRLRLDLTVHVGGTDGVLHIISDGSTVWEEVYVGKGEHFISSWDLKKVQEKLHNPATLPQIAEQFYRSRSFAGVLPLLQNIRDQMTFIKQEEAEWQKHKVVKLTAVWSADVRKKWTPQDGSWPPLLPRSCRLYLGKTAPHWPYRLEWFGPNAPQGEDSLLMEMEFLNPQITSATEKAPLRYRGLFTFDPGKAKVVDRTKQISDLVALQVQNQPKAVTKPADARGAVGAPPR
jgi:hypothetical protein